MQHVLDAIHDPDGRDLFNSIATEEEAIIPLTIPSK